MDRKLEGCVPFLGELGPHLTQRIRCVTIMRYINVHFTYLLTYRVAWTEAYLCTKWHLGPSNRLATIHQRHRQTGQRSDSIGQTVLQTVAQKPKFSLNFSFKPSL